MSGSNAAFSLNDVCSKEHYEVLSCSCWPCWVRNELSQRFPNSTSPFATTNINTKYIRKPLTYRQSFLTLIHDGIGQFCVSVTHVMCAAPCLHSFSPQEFFLFLFCCFVFCSSSSCSRSSTAESLHFCTSYTPIWRSEQLNDRCKLPDQHLFWCQDRCFDREIIRKMSISNWLSSYLINTFIACMSACMCGFQ